MDRRSFLIGAAAGFSRVALPPGIVALAGCSGTAATPDTVGFSGATMGTRYNVRMGIGVDAGELATLAARAQAALDAIDARMSTYRRDSELSRFNAIAQTDWQALSVETAAVIARSLDASAASRGAFDATIGPLVNLWGFGPQGAVQRAPRSPEIDRLSERVGWRHVEVHQSGHAVRKLRGNVSLDLSGIAKGYGADAVANVLRSANQRDFLVEVGGELVTMGQRPGGEPWRVGIERPVPGARGVQRRVDLKGRAIATSGDYRNFFVDGERRYAHTINPRSGRPVGHALASASVVASSAVDADSASTTLMVLGPEAGAEWATARGLAAHFLIRDGARLREHWTPAFETHLAS